MPGRLASRLSDVAVCRHAVMADGDYRRKQRPVDIWDEPATDQP